MTQPTLLSAAAPAEQAGAKNLVLTLACIAFLTLGMLTSSLGPCLQNLADHIGASLALMGSVFTALFLGALFAQGLAGPGMDRLGARPVLLAGLTIIGIGSLGLGLSPWLWLALASTVLAGLGHGAVDVTINVMVSELYPQRRAAAVNLVNVFFGVGAFLGPMMAGLALRLWDTALPALWLASGMTFLLIPLVWLWVPRLAAPAEAGPQAAYQPSLLTAPRLWVFGLLLLVYVGVENGVGGWTPSYLERSAGMAAAQAAMITSGFWLAITISRAAATLLGTRVAPQTLLAGSLGLALLGGLVQAAGAGQALLSVCGVLLLGLGFGPIFPTTIALITADFRGSTGAAAGVAVALGSLGGMLLPWLQGFLLTRLGPPAHLGLTLAGGVGMLLLYALYRQMQPGKGQAPRRL